MDKLSKLNWLAIGTMVILSMAGSMVWYSAFQGPWLEAVGITMEQAENAGSMSYVVALVGALITYTTMAYLFRRMQIVSAANGVKMAALFFIGFIAFETMASNMFSLRPFDLTLIDGGATFVNWLIGGAVLGAWQKGETVSEAAKDIVEEIR